MKDYTKYWRDKGNAVIKFDYEDVKAATSSTKYAKYLSEYGLPEDAAPYLNFDNSAYKDEEFMLADDFDDPDGYFVIGFTATGNGICIEAESDKVVWVDSDNGEVYLMNSSLEQLYECMLVYAEFVEKTGEDYTEEAINSLEDKLREIDEEALEADKYEEAMPFWAEEIGWLYGELQ